RQALLRVDLLTCAFGAKRTCTIVWLDLLGRHWLCTAPIVSAGIKVPVSADAMLGSELTDRYAATRVHDVVGGVAAPNTGVNTITGEGLKEAMAGAQVVIDLANSPSFEAKAVLEFFETSGRNLHAAEAAAGVRHHVVLSIVGTDRSDNGYFRAKVAQEKLIKASGIPYTIIRSTQFLEFLRGIVAS